MVTRIRALFKNTFVKNVMIVASGTAGAQILAMALIPIITRLYGPEQYGFYTAFNAIVLIITPIAALTFPIGIVLPKKDSEAKGLARLSFFVSVIIAMVTILLLLLFHQQIISLFKLESISEFIYLIPLVILFASLLQIGEQWLIRKKQFKYTAKVTFLGALIVQGSTLLIGFFSPVAAVLIVMMILGQGIKAGMMIYFAKREMFKKGDPEDHSSAFSKKTLAKKYVDFPKYRAPETFINAASQSIPVLMLSSFFGPVAVGLYGVGKSILAMPTQLLGKSVGDVFYPKISEAANNGQAITGLIMKATLVLGAIGVVPYGLVILIGPWLFGFVLGSEWATAGEYGRWIALWSLFGFMNRPSVMALPVLSAQKFHLKMTVVMLIVRMVALALGYYLFQSDVIAIAFFGVSGAILNIILILLTIRLSKAQDKRMAEKAN
ncbi:lipopolysaccharide biosynthesis protein [Evansella sp. AB-rgal1]|uniref:lipopolysaccharide biosynthesis protein n=1 Tax=Evansella sp. AB-rgal1 TaxID=3242696 RepID=UPI00359E588E